MKKVYTTLEDIQAVWMGLSRRTNQGKFCNGRIPLDTFTQGLDLCRTYIHERKEDDMEAA